MFVSLLFFFCFFVVGVTTVYELLEQRFGRSTSKAAGALFLLGRVLAGGARVYLAAIAVSMVMFANISAEGVILAAFLIVAASFLFTFAGGLRSVIWNDLVQLVLFIGAALAVLWYLHASVALPIPLLRDALALAPNGQN